MFFKFVLYVATLSLLFAAPESFNSLGKELETFNNDCKTYQKMSSLASRVQKQCKKFNQDIKKVFKVGYRLDAIIAKGKENEKLLNKYLKMLRTSDKKKENLIDLIQKTKALARNNANHKVYQQLIQLPSLHLYSADYKFLEVHKHIYVHNDRYKQHVEQGKERELETQRKKQTMEACKIKTW